MAHPYFQETQKFSPRLLAFIVIVSMLAGLGPLIYFMFVDEGEAEVMTNFDTTLLITVVFLVLMIPILIMLSSKMYVEVYGDKIRFKFPPFMIKWREIHKDSIETYQPETYRTLQYGGYGIRKSFFSSKTAIIAAGNKAIFISLIDGKKWVIGTHKQDEFKRALDQMMASEELN